MSSPSVAVIGAGVIGSAVARSLARRGAEVTVFDREQMGAGTSSVTFSWVNSNGKSPDAYHELNLAGMREHEQLQASTTSEAYWYVRTGTYEWATDPGKIDRLSARVERLRSLDYPIETIGAAELTARIPELRVHPRAGQIVRFPQEGYVWPSVLLARLWSEARDHGAVLRAPVDVVDVVEETAGMRLALSNGETWTGDHVVCAVGRWSAPVVRSLGLELAMVDPDQPNKYACGFLGSTDAQYVQLSSNLITPELNVRPDGAGRLLLQAPDLDHRADPAHEPDTDSLIGREMLHRLQRLFENTQRSRIERIRVGQRSRPADGLPAVGHVGASSRFYLIATHSGITLAPLLGRLVADELLDGVRSPLLTDYAPDRLVGRTADDFPVFATLHYPSAQ